MIKLLTLCCVGGVGVERWVHKLDLDEYKIKYIYTYNRYYVHVLVAWLIEDFTREFLMMMMRKMFRVTLSIPCEF